MSAYAKPFNPKQEFEHERLENASLFADSDGPRHQPTGATVVPGICFGADGHPLTLLIYKLLPRETTTLPPSKTAIVCYRWRKEEVETTSR
jgi:hypothetical protein